MGRFGSGLFCLVLWVCFRYVEIVQGYKAKIVCCGGVFEDLFYYELGGSIGIDW